MLHAFVHPLLPASALGRTTYQIRERNWGRSSTHSVRLDLTNADGKNVTQERKKYLREQRLDAILSLWTAVNIVIDCVVYLSRVIPIQKTPELLKNRGEVSKNSCQRMRGNLTELALAAGGEIGLFVFRLRFAFSLRINFSSRIV